MTTNNHKMMPIKITIFLTLLSLLYTPLRDYSQLVVTGIYFAIGVIFSIMAYIMMKKCGANCITNSEHHSHEHHSHEHHSHDIESPHMEETIDHSVTQTLAMLQKNGRLIDFLKEDISGYSDEQVGAAVRTIHKGCVETLDEYVKLESVIDKVEGDQVTIEEADYSPSAIRLTGNVSAKPPYIGVLQHCGWRITKTEFPKRAGNDQSIVAPAVIEIP